MIDLQKRHSQARGIHWFEMLQKRRRTRSRPYLVDEVDKCSQSVSQGNLPHYKICLPLRLPDCLSRAEKCAAYRGPPGPPGTRGEPGGLAGWGDILV